MGERAEVGHLHPSNSAWAACPYLRPAIEFEDGLHVAQEAGALLCSKDLQRVPIWVTVVRGPSQWLVSLQSIPKGDH